MGNKIKEQVNEMLCCQFGITDTEITSHIHLIEDLGADSLDMVEMMMWLEEHFYIELEDEECENIKTVQEIYKLVNYKISPMVSKSTPYLKDQKEYIICSAIWYKDDKVYNQQPVNVDSGYVLCGYRHGDCLSNMFVFGQKRIPNNDEEGFLTNLNRFVNRIEAVKIAYNAGQVKEVKRGLISEDLW